MPHNRGRLSTPPIELSVASFAGGWLLYDMTRLSDAEPGDEPEPGRDSILFPRFKLQAPAGQPQRKGARRAFWLHWSVDELRFCYTMQTKLLRDQYPELADEVELWLTLNMDAAAIEEELAQLADGGRDEARALIEAERARLRAAKAERRAKGDRGQARRDQQHRARRAAHNEP